MGVLKRVNATQLVFESSRGEPYGIYLENQLLVKGTQTTTFQDPRPTIHPVFEVRYKNKIEYVREQSLFHTGVINFRDLGGYATLDGRQVKHGFFYRCAAFVKLNELQKEYLDSLHICKLYDFRSSMEVKGNEDYLPKQTTYVHASAFQELEDMGMNGNFDFASLMQQYDLEQLHEFITSMYQNLPIHNQAYQKVIADMLENQTPIAFHCSAGKDRTGIMAMLILSILGVSKDVIIEDYLLSNELRKEANHKVFENVKKDQKGMEALMYVNADAIESCYTKIEEVYGNFETYILKEFGIDEEKRNKLKQLYLYAI